MITLHFHPQMHMDAGNHTEEVSYFATMKDFKVEMARLGYHFDKYQLAALCCDYNSHVYAAWCPRIYELHNECMLVLASDVDALDNEITDIMMDM